MGKIFLPILLRLPNLLHYNSEKVSNGKKKHSNHGASYSFFF